MAVRQSNETQERTLRRQGIDVAKAATSGYFVLAGVEGTSRRPRRTPASRSTRPRGGKQPRVIVVPKQGAFDEDTVG